MEHDVGPERDRPLEHGGGEGVVHHGQRAGRAGESDGAGQIDHPQQGIGRRFQPEEPGLGTDRRRQGREVGHVHEVRADPPVGEKLFGGFAEAIVDVAGQEHVRARRQGLEQGGAGRHAGGEDERRLPPLEREQGLLELLLVGVGLADIGVPAQRDAPLVAGEGGREVDGRGDRSGRGVDPVAGVHREGLESHDGETSAAPPERKRAGARAPALVGAARCGRPGAENENRAPTQGRPYSNRLSGSPARRSSGWRPSGCPR